MIDTAWKFVSEINGKNEKLILGDDHDDILVSINNVGDNNRVLNDGKHVDDRDDVVDVGDHESFLDDDKIAVVRDVRDHNNERMM
ncbi:hypothetical protein NPIL_442921 [Nephila pilipes]|uniref:Uncharacterized protein n=1 Tax=Nephila pilipes TaxID=299642 RepID=A0A8X6NQ60_NEPPI|nr:hypothetical protein NPIL_442921 [Nephila pilipes]